MRFWFLIALFVSLSSFAFGRFFDRQLNQPCKPIIDDCRAGLSCKASPSCLLYNQGKISMCCRRRRHGK